MTLIDPMLQEMTREAQATRALFDRVPEDKLGWRPHPKSFSLGQLALHVAQIPTAVAMMAPLDVFESTASPQREATSRAELLEVLDQGLTAIRGVVSRMDDRALAAAWTLRRNGASIVTMPRIGMLRTILLNHYYHHRGQLTVYLRLLDVPLPPVYGPTADENPFG